MEGKINILDPLVSAKVAAGEVVEGPSSVVKELMENSIDAGASSITVAADDGGRRLIRVTDDGCGMDASDAALLFRRHATSKISSEEDLYRIRTMGFRGEALYSISAVSRISIRTKKAGQTAGVEIKAVDNSARSSPAGCPEGTTVEVQDIFYNTPGRLKFLKSSDSEFGKILDVFRKIALIYPQKRFRLIKNSDIVIDGAGGSLRDRVIDIFGAGYAGKLLEIARLNVCGFAAEPDITYSNSRHVFIYVNKRCVQDKGILRAVLDGYGRLLEPKRYPFALVDIRVPPSDVDVNIHPRKAEVRFKQGSDIYDAVKAAVRNSLATTPRPLAGNEIIYGAQSAGPGTMAKEPMPAYGAAFARQAPQGQPIVHGEDAAGDVKSPWLLSLSVVGQLWAEFLIAEDGAAKDAFYIIDQHAAAERCAFERLKMEYRGSGVKKQLLLVPERLDAGHEESVSISEALGELDRAGFEIDLFGRSPAGGSSFLIKAAPAILSGRSLAGLVKDVSEDLTTGSRSSRIEDAVDACLMRIACHGVIRGPRRLAPEEGSRLLKDLSLVDFASRCPHGRPVIKRLSRAELDAYFKRR